VVGGFVAAVGYWVGAVIALLMMHGIPLGGPGGGPSRGDVVAHLVIAAVAALAGTSVAIRIERQRAGHNAVILALLLATIVLFGFSKRGSSWPTWFPIAMAAASFFGGFFSWRFTGRRS